MDGARCGALGPVQEADNAAAHEGGRMAGSLSRGRGGFQGSIYEHINLANITVSTVQPPRGQSYSNLDPNPFLCL